MESLQKFMVAVDDDEQLLGVSLNDDGFLVEHVPTKIKTMVAREAIEKYEWEELQEVLTLGREPDVIDHMTRTCGYFALRNNMNVSKVAEWDDRRKGNYALDSAAAV